MQKKRILLADDSRIALNLQAYILESAGFACVKAENGFVALEQLLRGCFDLVITDINMPRMDGYELTRKIRQTEGCADTPIIIISTLQAWPDRQKGMEAGANVYVVKPAQPEVLITHVKMLLCVE